MFKELKLNAVYTSANGDIAKEFYNPVLRHAVSFDRTSAYFSAKALAKYAEGLEYFGEHGYEYRIIISHNISEEDYEEIKKGYEIKKSINDELIDKLSEKLTLKEEQQISNLAYFIATDVVKIKIAFKTPGIFHDKCGIFTDEVGDVICFRGSNNETEAAEKINYESFQLTCSWIDSKGFYNKGIEKSQDEFNRLWKNEVEGLIVLPASLVIVKEIIKHNKNRIIIDERMLQKDVLILDYDGTQMSLQVNTSDLDWLTMKAFYKLKIEHKVEQILGNIIYFRKDLVYPDFIAVDTTLKQKIPSLGYSYFSTDRLQEYIKQRNLYIEKRAKLGIELKTDPSNLERQYQEFKDVVNATFVRTLRDKQMKDAFFMTTMMRSGNFSVPGSGKTSSALAAFSYLRYKKLTKRVVVICPINAFASWIDEFNSCFGEKLILNYFSIQDDKYMTAEQKISALKYDTENCNLFLFNYEGVERYLDEIKNIVAKETLLVFDEVHKVKAINGQRATQALEISKYAIYTIAMTGTPIPNSYRDLYNMLHILYNDEYKDFFGFETYFLNDPSPVDIEYINQKIQPFFCRTTKKELNVPDANPDISIENNATDDEQKIFEIIRKKYRRNKLALFIRILQLESNPKMLLEALDLRDFENIIDIDEENIDDIDFEDYSEEIEQLIKKNSVSTKKKACLELTIQLVKENKKVIIWCIFRDSIANIKNELVKMGIKAEYITGDVPVDERTRLINSFKNNEYDVLVTNPHTLAESISIHQVCHDAIYFEYSYNLVHLLQSKDRIHRLGLPKDQYTQYYFMKIIFKNRFMEDYSMDEEVYQRLMKKEKVMLDAIDNQELEPVYTTEEDLKLIFEKLF